MTTEQIFQQVDNDLRVLEEQVFSNKQAMDKATPEEENRLYQIRDEDGRCVNCGLARKIKNKYCQNCLDESEADELI